MKEAKIVGWVVAGIGFVMSMVGTIIVSKQIDAEMNTVASQATEEFAKAWYDLGKRDSQ